MLYLRLSCMHTPAQVCCGAEATLVLTCQQLPPTVQQPQHHHSATADITQPQQHQQHQQGQHEQAPTTNDTASTAAAAAASSSPKQPQPQRKAKQSKGPKQRAQDTCSQAQHNPAGALAASSTSTSSGSSRARVGGKHGRKGRHSELAPVDSSAAADEAAEAAESSSLLQLPGGNNRSTPTVGVPWQDVEEQGPYFCPPVRVGNKASGSRSSQLQDFDDDEDAAARSSSNRRRRSASGAASSTSSDNVSSSSRHPRMDKGFKRLLRRLLTGFLADSSQRELTFPASLSPADRWGVLHAWGALFGHSQIATAPCVYMPACGSPQRVSCLPSVFVFCITYMHNILRSKNMLSLCILSVSTAPGTTCMLLLRRGVSHMPATTREQTESSRCESNCCQAL